MKNAIKVLCFVLAVLIAGTVGVYISFFWQKSDFDFIDGVNKGTTIITGYKGSSVNIKIPDKIRGKKVVSIDTSAFEHSNIESVKISKNVTSVGNNAFSDCQKLKDVDLGSVKSIGDGVFLNCPSIEIIKIPSSVNKIGFGIFEKCSSLKEVDVSDNDNYVIENDVLYNNDKTVLYEAMPWFDKSEFVCPESVKTINKFAFNEKTALKSFEYTGTVIKLDDGTFAGCKNLKKLILPDGMKDIGALVVTGSGVKVISVPSSVVNIDKTAFYLMDKIKIVAESNSKIERFAKDNNLKCDVK